MNHEASYSTAEAAMVLGVTEPCLARSVNRLRVRPPAKDGSGHYRWTPADIRRAGLVILHRDPFAQPVEVT